MAAVRWQFWELDADHDFLICKEDLLRYGNHSLTYRIVDRIFSQVTSRTQYALMSETPVWAPQALIFFMCECIAARQCCSRLLLVIVCSSM